MGQEMYPALSGGLRSMRSMDVLANNLANVNTTGFKADRAAFILEAPTAAGPEGTAEHRLGAGYVALDDLVTDFGQGVLQPTGNPTDLALLGDSGFFQVEGAGGEVLLTRDGAFAPDPDGNLATRDGLRVLSVEGAPISVAGGNFTVEGDGAVTVNGAVAGTLAVVDADRAQLSKAGNNRWLLEDPASLRPADARVVQGHLEGSNVEPVRALTELIAITRYYEAFQKSLETSSELDEQLAARVGRVDS